MEIPRKAWNEYIRKLHNVNKKAEELMRGWIDANGYDSIEELVYWASGLTQKYGEAAATLACEMYDAIAEASGVSVAAAVPAEVYPEGYIAKAVRDTLDIAPTTVPNLVGRMVKQAGADTMLQNAARDGAQFAWIPHGDTCAFCITLASRGWQYMSKNALKNGHAEHIHSNCDCEYAVRFDERSGVAGYDPQKYEEMYRNADGNTPQEKINAMRRAFAEKQSKSVEEVVKKIAFVPAKTIEEAEAFAKASGVKYVNYQKLPIDTANKLNEAIQTLPENVRPLSVSESRQLEQWWGAKLKRTSKQYYGVTISDFDGVHLGIGNFGGIDDHGEMVAISSSWKDLSKVGKEKLAFNERYAAKYGGHTWYFNPSGETVPAHEIGHVYANVKGLPDGFDRAAKRWAEETKCDMLTKPTEAWAEAWASYHTGVNADKLPEYIVSYIERVANGR